MENRKIIAKFATKFIHFNLYTLQRHRIIMDVKDMEVVTMNGNVVTIQLGSRGSQSTWDDDDYDCACCIGGFSK